MTPVINLEDGSWTGSSQPVLAERQISLKENLSQVQRMIRRTTPNPSALRLALAFAAE